MSKFLKQATFGTFLLIGIICKAQSSHQIGLILGHNERYYEDPSYKRVQTGFPEYGIQYGFRPDFAHWSQIELKLAGARLYSDFGKISNRFEEWTSISNFFIGELSVDFRLLHENHSTLEIGIGGTYLYHIDASSETVPINEINNYENRKIGVGSLGVMSNVSYSYGLGQEIHQEFPYELFFDFRVRYLFVEITGPQIFLSPAIGFRWNFNSSSRGLF